MIAGRFRLICASSKALRTTAATGFGLLKGLPLKLRAKRRGSHANADNHSAFFGRGKKQFTIVFPAAN